ncbi:chromatin-remodeling ATPase INO80-like [Teleopsis dalmanni]|uniref:chromatin-remodeling ATPase INO80-like n=1 Tax=Teleopsis dalmanni TaxID=139649 RepID=UPI0018CF04D5|nr:chromatin-remodeling ATPase INO80-like [Teleopsis dalmanni]
MNISKTNVNGLTGAQVLTASGTLSQPSRQSHQIRESTVAMAKPLHLQRLERALDMKPFMKYAREILAKPLSSEDDSAEDSTEACSDNESENGTNRKKCKKLFGSRIERQNIKMHLYNFSELSNDREWLFSIVLSDTESESELSDEDDYIKQLLKSHRKMQKERERYYKTPTNNQYTYYGSGFLSCIDMHPDHQQSIIGVRKRKRRAKNENKSTLPKLQKLTKIRKSRKNIPNDEPESGEIHPSELKNYAFGDTSAVNDDDLSDEADAYSSAALSSKANSSAVRSKSRRNLLASPEVLAARRKRVWQLMCKKEITRCHRLRINNHKEVIQSSKRVAGMCMKVVRQRAMQSQRVMKETVWRAKRLSREMLGYWKRYERVERDTRKRMEREAEEQRKMDVEIIEAKRQQRKLNFLITQTELYAHFMSKKLGQGTEEEQLRILSQLDDEKNPRLAAYDDYDAEHMKQLAQKNAETAFNTDRVLKHQFDVATRIKEEQEEAMKTDEITGPPVKADLPQPTIFKGTLKTYQIKGMTWLANLYDQGISGILADEMGLGKTVQSIAFLCHVAEHYGVWGPFLVISPASTLHNWQQELARFVPEFNVVPYWGSPNERKILRQFWEQKDLHTRDASFHVVITSYQLIVSDYKYFNRIKWQYMVLDEAQAIKSASSMRWKLLLGFNCRNRLLLSGTPIQNSMAELWALLHFIMPTLFDSHDEFNEWFSKDIESHAENKTGIDEKQISRLHMILKPFMLRRIKKDVENELSDKIEIMVYCPLTIRQKLLYMALKKKIRIEDLLHLTRSGAGSSSDGGHVDRNFTSNLMNLVMQFRKVCNHPELFERRDVKSPFAMRCQEYVMPRLVYDDGVLKTALPSKRHLLYNRFLIYKAEHVHRSMFSEPKANNIQKSGENYSRYIDLNVSDDCCFSFTRLSDISPKNLEDMTVGGLISSLQHYRFLLIFYKLLSYRRLWWTNYKPSRFQLLEPMLENPIEQCTLFEDSILKSCIFTSMIGNDSSVYAFGDYIVVNMQETMEHRVIRSKRFKSHKILNEEANIKDIKKESDIDIMTCDDEVTSVKSQLLEGQSKKTKTGTNELLPEFPYIARKPTRFYCEPLEMPKFLYGLCPRVQATRRRMYCESRAAEWSHIRHMQCENPDGQQLVYSSLDICKPRSGWSSLIIPDKQTLVSDAGKLSVLDSLLTRLKSQGHRVLIYSQMTKMIDLLEEYMWHRKHRYMRLDGSSKISARRDMVADFQTRADIFVFLLSTRAGGLGINLTAADTVSALFVIILVYIFRFIPCAQNETISACIVAVRTFSKFLPLTKYDPMIRIQ